MIDIQIVHRILLMGIPLLFAITFHEVSHGLIALKCGDTTAKRLGRLSLNPIKHIDLIGTIVVPLLLFFTAGFIFGWAKPVPVNYQQLKKPRRDMALVALAGPFSNLIMACIWATLAKIASLLDPQTHILSLNLLLMSQMGIMINLILALLNLLPIPPLDGSRVISSILSPKIAVQFSQYEIYGFLILVFLIATGLLSEILGPAVKMSYQFMVNLFNL